MAIRLTGHISSTQKEPILGRETEMGLMKSGGYGFKIDPMAQLRRFLILGTEGGTYYASERDITRENHVNLMNLVGSRPIDVINLAVQVSHEGLTRKNDYALYALAAVSALAKTDEARSAANASLPLVARTATHLFTFLEYRKVLGGGWGSSIKKAVQSWYLDKREDQLAYQLMKYRSRDGWTHRDVLRLAHPVPRTDVQNALFNHVTQGMISDHALFPDNYDAFVSIQAGSLGRDTLLSSIKAFKLPWEALPTEMHNDPEVWEVLIEADMPLTALMRNLPRFTTLGILKGAIKTKVLEQLTNEDVIQKARIHPLQALVAQLTYRSGASIRGSSTWTPITQVSEALEETFYKSFKFVEPTGKRILLAQDVSASMGGGMVAGVPGLTPAMASACMLMVTARVEKDYEIRGFSTEFKHLDIAPGDSLQEVVRKISNQTFGGTDCSLPMVWAKDNRLDFDAFVIYTDNETWAGRRHPNETLKSYRTASGIDAKMVVVGMTATNFSIADPKDTGMLDVVGFDASAPAMISEFVRGGL